MLLAEFRGCCHDGCAGYTLDPRQFIDKNAGQAAYGAGLPHEAATIEDDALLVCATQEAAAYVSAGYLRQVLQTAVIFGWFGRLGGTGLSCAP